MLDTKVRKYATIDKKRNICINKKRRVNMDKEIVLEKEKQENKQEEIPVLQNENQEESLVDTDSKLHKTRL